ncbi:MAG: mobile mystery protein B [Pirellulales bacterium]
MSGPLFSPDNPDETLLEPDERRQLLLPHIATRAQLNEAEQQNITDAAAWAFGRRRDVLSERFLLSLHKRMLGLVWRWAGTIRSSDRNIGVAFHQIRPQMRLLIDDARYWVEHAAFPPDEIALRFHHRLVLIHPFPNGNGRHGRLAADLLAVRLGQRRLTWGIATLLEPAETRRRYIAALRAADAHEISPLLEFARS